MRLVFLLLALLFTMQIALAQDADCTREVKFGTVDICLPQIASYEEAYTVSSVKKLADMMEVPSNKVLAYYIDDATFQKIDAFGTFPFENYFKIYATKELENVAMKRSDLDQIQKMLADNFMSKNWDEMKSEIEELEVDIQVETPIVIEQYRVNEDSFTMLMLATYKSEGTAPVTVAMTMNGLLIQDRMIWMAYYLDFDGQSTFKLLKQNSDKILTAILSANK